MPELWQDQLKKALNGQSIERLKDPEPNPVGDHMFKTVITADVLTILNKSDSIRNQFLPTEQEAEFTAGYHQDPVGDHDALAQQGIIHKYHGRVLLVASGSCAVNCRYCFRRHFPYQKHLASRQNWQAVIDYLTRHDDVHEVILSGGDPLTLTTESLQKLTDQLHPLDHIETIRIHSRIPTVLPDRINSRFLEWLDGLRFNKILVTHINHANELTENAHESIKKLKQHNITLLNQSVLLKSVNDDADCLINLSHQLFDIGILPYYLHVFDRVQNAAHFDLDLSRAKRIYEHMRHKLPGYLLPKLVKEETGQSAKTPVL